jgi:tight adherence protein B
MAADVTYPARIESQPGFADILRDDMTYAPPVENSTGDRLNGWFDRLMTQSGLEITPPALLTLCVFAAVAVGGFVFVLQENLLSFALAAVLGFFAPLGTAQVVRVRRRSTMLRQMPGMIGELARAARTGRSLEQCFHLVAEDTPAPLGHELRLCDKRLRMGVSLPEAVEPLPRRTGLVSLNVLATTLAVHHQTGGDLIGTLERLQRTIRDRIMFLGRLRTATSASRATALLMVILPPAILAYFVFRRDPEYISTLLSSRWGWWTTMTAIVLQLVGSAWVLRILRNTERS